MSGSVQRFLLLSVAAPPSLAAVCDNGDCVYRIDSGHLWDNFWIRANAYEEYHPSVQPRFCNTTSWLSYFGCVMRCPVAFELMAPPEAAGMRLCLKDNEFEGGADLLHSDHALIGRELELAAAPATNSGGCAADGLDGVRGRVALLKAGGCDYVEQAANAGRSGAVATIIVNDRVAWPAEATWFQRNAMGGAAPSGGLNVTMMVSRGLGQPVLDQAAAGVQFRGRFVMECNEDTPQVAVAEMKGNWDSCPAPGEMNCAALAERWGGDEVDMLCTGCVLEAVIDGNDTVCLHSSTMLPLKVDNSLLPAATPDGQEFEARVLESRCRDGGGADPWSGETCAGIANILAKHSAESCDELINHYYYSDSVAWFSETCQKTCNPDCAEVGCSAAAFAGTSGRLVFAPSAGGACEMAAVRAASAAGVAAVVLPHKHVGTSLGVGVPVHYISPIDMDRVVAAAAARGNGTFRMRVRLGPGLAAPVAGPSGAPAAVSVLAADSGFTFTWPICVCAAGCVLLAVVNACIFLHQRRSAVKLEVAEADRLCRRVPLSVASLGVGVSLLACIAAVTFILVYNTGKETTDAALDEGWDAVKQTHANAVRQVELTKDQVLAAYSSVAQLGLKVILNGGKEGGRVLSRLFHNYDGGSVEYLSDAMDLMDAIAGSAAWGEHWAFAFRTTNGHFGGMRMRTVVDADGVKWVSAQQAYSGDRQLINTTAYNPMAFFGRQHGDALAMGRDMPVGSYLWYVCERPEPTVYTAFWNIGYRPLSVLYPMYSSAGEYVGVLEGAFDLYSFSDLLGAVVQKGFAANMTIVLVDDAGGIVSSTLGYRNQRYTEQQTRGYEYDDDALTEPMTLATMPIFELAALDAYLRETYGSLEAGVGTHELDQAEWYAKSGQQPVRAMHVTFDGGEAVDESDSKWRMRLGGGSSVVDGRGGRCLDVDGTSSLEVYKNLSTDLPRVRDGRNVTSPRFNAAWNHTRWMGDTEVVVVPDQYPWEESPPLEWFPLMREPVMGRQHTLAMWVRPRRVLAEAELDLSFGPSLWTDELSATSALRVTAAGRMVVRSLEGSPGCITSPYPGGLPVGAWTHVTAQLDTWETRFVMERKSPRLKDLLNAQMCRVFINGTLHSEHPMSVATYSHDVLAVSAAPYRVGHGFDGQIDDVVLYNVTLSADEVRQLAETGTLKRVAPSRRFYGHVSTFAEKGLRWLTVVTLPRDDVMREVDRLNELQRHNQGVRRDNIEKELSQRSVETILATVVIALASVTVFLLFSAQLTQPIGRLAKDMLDAAVLRTVRFDERRNVLAEIDVMNRAMGILVTNMRLYRSYLPQAVLAGLDSGVGVSLVEPPRGRVAITFTDIVGSTRLWEASPSTMNSTLELHNDVLRHVQSMCRGYEVKTIGDAFMVAFADAAAAVLYGVRVHEELLATRWPECPEFEAASRTWAKQKLAGAPVWNGIALRCGVSFGDVADESNPLTDRTDYRGCNVNLAARLESTGPVGLAQVSAECYTAVHGDPRLKHCWFVKRTGVELKGIDANATTYLVCTEKLRGRVQVWKEPTMRLEGRPSEINPLGRESRSGSKMSGVSSEASISCVSSSSHELLQSAANVHRPRMQLIHASVAELICMDGSMAEGEEAATAHQFNVNVQWMLACATRTQGKVMTVLGATAQVSWNVVSPCASASENLAFAGLYDGRAREIHIGTCSGPLLHGQMGDARQRFHTTAGLVPRCASALARAAADLQTSCLAAYIPDTPSSVQAALRPVDRWQVLSDRLQTGGVQRVLTVEEFLPHRYVAIRSSQHGRGADEEFEDTSDDAAKYRSAFRRAVVLSDQAALADLLQLARDSVGDPVLSTVVAALQVHQRRHPDGLAHRCAAPFSRCGAALPDRESTDPTPEGVTGDPRCTPMAVQLMA